MVLAFSMSTVAIAVPPTRERIAVHLTGPAPGASALCGFPIERDINGVLIQTTFFDKAGNPTRFLEVAPGFKVTFINPANGNTVSYPNVFSQHVTFNADGSVDVAFAGLIIRLIIPGEGNVTLDAGRLLLNISADGVETVVQESGPSGSFQPICDYLRGS
jgi:hypothetical protein